MKRFIAVLVCIFMLVSLLPAFAFAEEGDGNDPAMQGGYSDDNTNGTGNGTNDGVDTKSTDDTKNTDDTKSADDTKGADDTSGGDDDSLYSASSCIDRQSL